MPWLRGGTVAVTNGSTTVTGTNADFAANSRVGDAFIGPDGLNYEVANVASATVISIIPAYKGPTGSGSAYAIMPVNGYPKLLTDAFNNLNNQFGPVLAVLGTNGTPAGVRSSLQLGTVATENTVPVAKGGTGGTDQASARNGLGLGTVAVESTVPIAKGGTGVTNGRPYFNELGVSSAAVSYSTQGTYLGWNGEGRSGSANLICNRGGGAGGFTWRTVNSNNTATGPTMTYSYEGLLTVQSLSVSSPIALISGGTGANTWQGSMENLFYRTAQWRPIIASMKLQSPPSDVVGNGTLIGWNETGGTGEASFVCNRGGGSGGFIFRTVSVNNDAEIGRMTLTGPGNLTINGTLTQGSDRRLKKNDKDITNGLEVVSRIRPVEYERRSNLTANRYGNHEAGVIAQELYEVLPLAVSRPSAENEETEMWGVNYTAIIPYLISAIQSLEKEVSKLKSAKD